MVTASCLGQMVGSMTASGTRAKNMVSAFSLMPKISISWENITKARKAETGSVKLLSPKNNSNTSRRRVKTTKGDFKESLMSSRRSITSTPDENSSITFREKSVKSCKYLNYNNYK